MTVDCTLHVVRLAGTNISITVATAAWHRHHGHAVQLTVMTTTDDHTHIRHSSDSHRAIFLSVELTQAQTKKSWTIRSDDDADATGDHEQPEDRQCLDFIV